MLSTHLLLYNLFVRCWLKLACISNSEHLTLQRHFLHSCRMPLTALTKAVTTAPKEIANLATVSTEMGHLLFLHIPVNEAAMKTSAPAQDGSSLAVTGQALIERAAIVDS